jgi:hypothetical protein
MLKVVDVDGSQLVFELGALVQRAGDFLGGVRDVIVGGSRVPVGGVKTSTQEAAAFFCDRFNG